MNMAHDSSSCTPNQLICCLKYNQQTLACFTAVSCFEIHMKSKMCLTVSLLCCFLVKATNPVAHRTDARLRMSPCDIIVRAASLKIQQVF